MTAAAKPPAAKPYAGRKLFVEPGNAAAQAVTWATSDPTGAAYMRALAKIPDASWVGDWERDPRRWVGDLLDRAGSALCVLAVYAIPDRDYGSDSAGGAADAKAYATWIAALAAGIEGREAIVVLEPDALAMGEAAIDDHRRTRAQVSERHKMIGGAVDVLTAAGGRVYIDAGDSDWIGADRMAPALDAAGVHRAAGAWFNTSHFEPTNNEHGYAKELRALLGDGVHYGIDTSRNGTGPHGSGDNRWRNPPDVGCGRRPTLNPTTAGCDALLWIKSVGGSDGDGGHDGAPAAGKWWPEFARRLCAAAVPPLVVSP